MTRDLFPLVFLFVVPLLAGCLSFHQGPMPGEPAAGGASKYAEVEGARVRYVDSDEEGKPAVVLVHGFASALDVWEGVRPQLAASHRVLAMDLKGFGWTDRPEGDYSPDAQAKLILKLMDARGIQRASFVAHSWGSSVVLALALLAPERVTKIALYDAWVYEEQIPPFFHWARADGVGETLFGLYYKQRADERIAIAFFDKRFVTEKLVDDIEEALDRPGTVAAALAAVRGQRYEEVQARYKTIDKPSLLLWGREDAVTPVRFGERLAGELPNAKLVTYPRCGHFPMIEALSASNRELLAFLSDDRASASAPVAPATPAGPQEKQDKQEKKP